MSNRGKFLTEVFADRKVKIDHTKEGVIISRDCNITGNPYRVEIKDLNMDWWSVTGKARHITRDQEKFDFIFYDLTPAEREAAEADFHAQQYEDEEPWYRDIEK